MSRRGTSTAVVLPEELPPIDVGAVLRAARQVARLSQRELADELGVSKSTVARLEAGGGASVTLVDVALRTMGCALVGVGPDGLPLRALTWEPHRDRGGRRYPAHLNVRPVEIPMRDWWYEFWATTASTDPPTHSFDLRGSRRWSFPRPQRLDGERSGAT